jgi:hypothetical protein
VIFSDGTEWAGAELLSHVKSWLTEVDKPDAGSPAQ